MLADALPQPAERQPEARAVAASQARLNEIVAEIIKGVPGDPRLIKQVLHALSMHNWAAGFAFEGELIRDERFSDWAVQATQGMESRKRAAAALARWESKKLEHAMPPDAAALTRRLKADAPALVYIIAHAALGAAKVGVSDAAGSRIAEHRRAGWQLIAAFHVAAYAACAIEADVLRWWRGELGLPPYLVRDQMPQGGWTETVAAGSVDLAATVEHVCALALLPEAKPAAR